jgi:hypothetical protein
MNDRRQVLALTQAAFLNALILSFLSLQFVLPPIFILLLWVLPTIFALEVYNLPAKIAVLSNVIVLAIAFILFGPTLGFWALVYLLVGGGVALQRQWHLPWVVRLPITIVFLTLALLGVTLAMGWVAQINWTEAGNLIKSVGMQQLLSVPVILLGLGGWAAILSLSIDKTLSKVLEYLSAEVTK